MAPEMLFVIGAPRSGTTMLEHMLSAHDAIEGGPEPHLLTPLAHLGVWDMVDKAPYDHVLAAESQKLFVSKLPNGKADYWAACRAYCDVLYGAFMTGRSGRLCLDKTPAYALVLPFMMRVFPDARYVVLTRHPLAMFSSFANSFFDGDYEAAHRYNPVLERYIPAMATFLRQTDVPFIHVRYEDLVASPELEFEKICTFIGVSNDGDAVNYGEKSGGAVAEGLGDPLGVQQHTRPSTASLDKWVGELAHDEGKRSLMESMIAKLDPADLAVLGYPTEQLWDGLAAGASLNPPRRPRLSRYRLQRRAILVLRGRAQRHPGFRALLKKIRLACDVLTRE
tara:strand:+ start:319 stop:1329 length:1011 start_codon:yes stop_codon:yes gene_type:complete